MTAEDGTDVIRRWIPTLIVALGLAVSWGATQSKLDVLAEEVVALEVENSLHNAREAQDGKEVTELKANQRAIKEDVEEIKERQKEQDKKLDKILEELRELD